MAERPTTVEIFHDEATGELSLDAVYRGMSAVSNIVGDLHVVSDSSKAIVLDGQYSADYGIAVDHVRWPKFEADLNIIVTKRRLMCEQEASLFDSLLSDAKIVGRLAVGVAYSHPDVGRVAIVKMNEFGDRAATTSHELGHLYDLKNGGSKHDDYHEMHCRDRKCTMYFAERDEPDTMWSRDRVVGQHFCNECAEQLAQNAYWRAEKSS